jgi:hypothetical protein
VFHFSIKNTDQTQEWRFFKEMVSNMQVTILSEGGLRIFNDATRASILKNMAWFVDMPLPSVL